MKLHFCASKGKFGKSILQITVSVNLKRMDEVLQFFIAIFNKNDELLLPPTLVAGIIKFPNKLPENMTIKGGQQTWNENGYS